MANDPHTPQWHGDELADPHHVADKARRVRSMFAAIAPSYDLNNRLHSLWRDQAWRRKVVGLCRPQAGDTVVDVACGTGDLSMAFARAGAGRVVGIDFTHEMVRIARQKSPAITGEGPAYADGDAMRLPLADASADIVTIAFGIRNVTDPLAAIGEFHRVLRPGGRLCILEFSIPTFAPLRAAYMLYFRHIMPRTATLISGDRSGAYRYLPQSVNTFLSRKQMQQMLSTAGFTRICQHPMSFGIAVGYLASK